MNKTWTQVSEYRYNNFTELLEKVDSFFGSYEKENLRRKYDEATDFAKSVISFEEFLANVLRVMNVLEEYTVSCTPSSYSVSKNVLEWMNNKAPLLKAMKASPLYDSAHPYKLIGSMDAERIADDRAVCKYMDTFLDVVVRQKDLPVEEDVRTNCRYVLRELVNPNEFYAYKGTVSTGDTAYNPETGNFEFKWTTSREVKMSEAYLDPTVRGKIMNLISCFHNAKIGEDEITAYENFRKNINWSTYWSDTQFLDYLDKCNPHENQKTSRFIRNLIETMFGFVNERDFGIYADGMNPTVFTKCYAFSLDPVDYLLMSNGTGWVSCHRITNDYEGGEYSAGVWGYMNDDVSFITYTLPKETTENFELKEKVTREVVAWNGEFLYNARVYPQSNDNDTQKEITYREHRQYAQHMISAIFGLPNNWKTRHYLNGYDTQNQDNRIPVAGDPGYRGYDDWRYYDAYCSVTMETLAGEDIKDFLNNCDQMTIGATGYCPECGNALYDNNFTCCQGEKYYCADCGCVIDPDDAYYINGEYYCADCAFYDDYADEYVACREYERIEIICKGNWGTYRQICSDDTRDRLMDAGRIFYDDYTDEYYDAHDYEYSVVESGYNTYTYCETTVERFIEDGTLVECENCGEYVFKEDATELDGLWYCKDCIDDAIAEKEAKEEAEAREAEAIQNEDTAFWTSMDGDSITADTTATETNTEEAKPSEENWPDIW